MASIIYCMIANETSNSPLVQVSLAKGNFAMMALKILPRIQKNSSKSYSYERKYTYHCHNSDGLTLICMADQSFKSMIVYNLIFDIKDRFLARYGDQVRKSIAYGANKEFSQIIRQRIQYYNTNSEDKLAMSRSNLNKTREVMIENIEKVLQRGEKIQVLVNKTAHMSDTAVKMRNTAKNVKRFFWWKNCKLTLLIIGIVLVILFFVLVLACGGFTFSNCT